MICSYKAVRPPVLRPPPPPPPLVGLSLLIPYLIQQEYQTVVILYSLGYTGVAGRSEGRSTWHVAFEPQIQGYGYRLRTLVNSPHVAAHPIPQNKAVESGTSGPTSASPWSTLEIRANCPPNLATAAVSRPSLGLAPVKRTKKHSSNHYYQQQ